jgi:hypothetical protein
LIISSINYAFQEEIYASIYLMSIGVIGLISLKKTSIKCEENLSYQGI